MRDRWRRTTMPRGAARMLRLAVPALVLACEHAPSGPGASVSSVTIATAAVDLAQGQTYCFSAHVAASGGTDRSVTWRARHGLHNGSMDADGCYEADSVGTDTIIAASTVDPGTTAIVTVTIRPADPWPLAAMTDLALPTYDGSGQAIHPSELTACPVRSRWRYRTAVTPYPYLKSNYENPSVFVSSDQRHWVLQPGTPNPLVMPGTATQTSAVGKTRYYTGLPAPAWSTLSDPDFVCDSVGHAVRLYFRQIGDSAEYILYMQSRGDSNWSPPQTVMVAHPEAGGEMISPSFVYLQQAWRAWFVRGACGATSSEVRTSVSTDGTTGFSDPETVDIEQAGYVIWHLQVRAFAGALWMLYSAYPNTVDKCYAGDLFLARSDDGRSWSTFEQPVLNHLDYPQFEAGLYRSSMLYDSASDVLTVQVSGYYSQGTQLAAATGTIRFGFTQLLSGLTPAAGATVRPRAREPRLAAPFHSPLSDGEARGFLVDD